MKLISKGIAFILGFTFLLLMFMIYKLNLIPTKYFIIIGGILLVFVLGLVFKLIRKKTSIFSRIFFDLISIGFIIIFIYGLTYINATHNFMNNILSKGYEIKNYVVVVNKKSNFSTIGDLADQNIGHLDTDFNYNLVASKINKNIKFKEKEFKDINSFINLAVTSYSDAIVLEEEYYNLLCEEYTDLNNSKVIKKYKIIAKTELKKIKKNNEDSFILYISGIDTYGNISSISRSDVNIIAVLNPKTGKILLVSIPRDYYVKLHNTNGINDKLTHAGLYGIDMSMNTIEDLLDTNIDYYLRLNFSTLTKSIDLLGGIDVYSDKTFTPNSNHNIIIKEGYNHMDGEMALAFARERYTYSSGDVHRGENQQAIITAMIKKMTTASNIVKYKNILTSLDGTFETSMSYEDLTDLFKMQIDKKIDWEVESISLSGVGSMKPTYSMGSRNLYVMIPDQNSILDAKNKINEYKNS